MASASFSRQLATLPNGLRVLTLEMPSRQRTLLSAYVRVGSRFESPLENGLSHFLEHMLFRGTKQLPDAYRFNRAVESIGGTLHAETRRDASLYQLDLPKESTLSGLTLLSQIFSDPVFSDLEIERNIILEEAREDYDSSGTDIHLSDLLYAQSFLDHPLGQKIIGPLDNITRFTRNDLSQHFDKHYGAKNLILCIAGDFPHAQLQEWTLRVAETIPQGQSHSFTTPTKTLGPRALHRNGDGGPQTTLNLSFRTEGECHDDFPVWVLLNRILDDGLSTRLYQRIVNELGLAYYVGASLDSFVDTGLFEIEAVAMHERIPLLLREFFHICHRLKTELVLPEELEHAKRRYRWDLLSACDEPYSLLEWWGATELYYSPLDLSTKLSRIQRVTVEDIQRAAQTILHPENLVLGSLGTLPTAVKKEVSSIFHDFQKAS